MRQQAVATASAQNLLDNPDSFNMHLTLSRIVLFILSATPFC